MTTVILCGWCVDLLVTEFQALKTHAAAFKTVMTGI